MSASARRSWDRLRHRLLLVPCLQRLRVRLVHLRRLLLVQLLCLGIRVALDRFSSSWSRHSKRQTSPA